MQAVYPHMQRQGWGRIVNFASSMGITGGARLRRVQRVEGSDPRAHAHRRARVGDRRHRRQRDRAGGGRRTTARPAKQSEGYRIFIENCPMSRQGDPELDIGRSRGSSAPTPAASSPATRSWPTAARSCGRDRVRAQLARRRLPVRRPGADGAGRLRRAGAISTTPRSCGCSTTCGSRTCVGAVGEWWPDFIAEHRCVVAARELHVLYESEGLPGESFVGAMRYIAARREGADPRGALGRGRHRARDRARRGWCSCSCGTAPSSTGPSATSHESRRSRGSAFPHARRATSARWGPPE